MADRSVAQFSTNKSVVESNKDSNKIQNNSEEKSQQVQKPNRSNVLGGELETCSMSPLTGFTRTGKCETNAQDYGTHLICAQVTEQFLNYTKSRGNDLSTPTSWFPGLKPGDNWCLCVSRWIEAYKDGAAPPPVLNATHQQSLAYLKRHNLGLDDLKKFNLEVNNL